MTTKNKPIKAYIVDLEWNVLSKKEIDNKCNICNDIYIIRRYCLVCQSNVMLGSNHFCENASYGVEFCSKCISK